MSDGQRTEQKRGAEMGLFKPSWQSKNPERRAKALDGLSQEKLMSIIRSESSKAEVFSAKWECVSRLNPAGLKAVALNEKLWGELRLAAVERIKEQSQLADLLRSIPQDRLKWSNITEPVLNRMSEETLGAVVLDPSASASLRCLAITRVKDEKTLAAYIQDGSAPERKLALKQMHTGMLIASCAIQLGAVSEGRDRLEELKDDDALRFLALNAGEMRSWDADYLARDFAKDKPFLCRLAREAKSDDIRIGALNELAKFGAAPPDLCAEAWKRASALMSEPKPDSGMIWSLLRFAVADSLTPEERDYLYRDFLKDPTVSIIPEFLKRCGDPAGIAFLPFIEQLYMKNRPVSPEDLEKVLDVPEDFALDYLLAFIRRGERGNSCLGGPRTMISGCADAILLMHQNGKARERIERELKAIQSYSISYRYSDSDNDIRDERDEFRVRYWK